MTEAAFQACRKLMQKANYLRGKITEAKGDVSKWTKIEATYQLNLEYGKAEGAKKQLDKAIKRLAEARERFAVLQFPDSNLKEAPVEPTKCNICGNPVAQGEECAECS